MKYAPHDDTIRDFTSQISGMLRDQIPCASGGFGSVYRCTIESSEGTKEVAVKIFSMAPHAGRDKEKIDKGIRRELTVWLKLRDSTIVPLLGSANVPELSLFPALVSEWMSSGTLLEYLKEQGTISTSTRVKLAKGIADGLEYLHSNKVVHGDLYPSNVLVDDSGHPRLTDFGLATVAGDAELQWNSRTPGRNFAPRWRAPEVLGVGHAGDIVVRPDFKSDMYSFGSVMFFIVSGVKPWEGNHQNHITIALSNKTTPARPKNIGNDHWNLIKTCWSWDPADRPEAKEVTKRLGMDITNSGETEMTGRPGTFLFATLWDWVRELLGT